MNRNFLGLPEKSLNALSYAVFFFIGCLGVKVVRTSDLALSVANTQLVTSNSANKLEQLAAQLEQQAEIIEQKDEAYQQLQNIYYGYKKQYYTQKDLDKAIEKTEGLPKVENIDQIQVEISKTESDLLELSN